MPDCSCQAPVGRLVADDADDSRLRAGRELASEVDEGRKGGLAAHDDGALALEVDREHDPEADVVQRPADDQETHGDEPDEKDVEGYPDTGDPVEHQDGRQKPDRGAQLAPPIVAPGTQAVELVQGEDAHEHDRRRRDVHRRERPHRGVQS